MVEPNLGISEIPLLPGIRLSSKKIMTIKDIPALLSTTNLIFLFKNRPFVTYIELMGC